MPFPALDILYVDDEPDLREIVTAALEMDSGFHVRSCANANDAWIEIDRQRPDLLILDVMMPGIDGPALFASLKARPDTADIPAVFMTAKVLQPELAHLRALEPAGIIQKPFDPRTLAAQIRRYCETAPSISGPSGESLDALTERMRLRFRGDAPAVAAQLRAGTALPADDPASARRIAHALCGTAGTLGFDEISQLAGAIDAAPVDALLGELVEHLAARLMALQPNIFSIF